jgi:hypothetical protein
VSECVLDVIQIELRAADPQVEIREVVNHQRLNARDQDPLADVKLPQRHAITL